MFVSRVSCLLFYRSIGYCHWFRRSRIWRRYWTSFRYPSWSCPTSCWRWCACYWSLVTCCWTQDARSSSKRIFPSRKKKHMIVACRWTRQAGPWRHFGDRWRSYSTAGLWLPIRTRSSSCIRPRHTYPSSSHVRYWRDREENWRDELIITKL